MSRFILISALLLFSYGESLAFCGFYVAKAGADLFNESSQVIMVRDGDHTVITMSNDFKGEVADFAMVVPVPEVLDRKDIRVVRQQLFSKFDAFTAPRMVEYYDPEPNCPFNGVDLNNVVITGMKVRGSRQLATASVTSASMNRKLKVKVKAKYKVDEYDIVILSAKQSDGLEKWLKWNGYKMPENAREALEPYIQSGMNFFVVKVNLARQAQNGFTKLRPLQIQFNSPKFMLPIRLGMANAKAAQDMVVYAFTKTGRVETTNYRTVKVPTDREIPHIFKRNGQFGSFYKAVFEKSWKEDGRNSVFLEYAWDQTGTNPVKCDPCNSPLITKAEMEEAGVWWLKPGVNGGYTGDLHVTRLHVRYARDKFPQDLAFMVTPNKEKFQARYVVRHPARGPFNCERAEKYLAQLEVRFKKEVVELASLTGWDPANYQSYVASVPPLAPKDEWYGTQPPAMKLEWEPVMEEEEEEDRIPEKPRQPIQTSPTPTPKSPKEVKTAPASETPAPTAPKSPEREGGGVAALPQDAAKTMLPQDAAKSPAPLEASLATAPAAPSTSGSGIILAISGLLLGLAFFIRQRKSNSETHSR